MDPAARRAMYTYGEYDLESGNGSERYEDSDYE